MESTNSPWVVIQPPKIYCIAIIFPHRGSLNLQKYLLLLGVRRWEIWKTTLTSYFLPHCKWKHKRRLKVHHPWDQEVLICDFTKSRNCYLSFIPSTHQWHCSTQYLACNRSWLNICQMLVDWDSFWAHTNAKTTTNIS